jgi:Holliday junction resolvase
VKKMNKARKGADFERELMKLALQKGATLVMRGASSKSRSTIPNLKVDLVIVKGNTIYFVQAKHHKRRATPKEKEKFFNAVWHAGLQANAFTTEADFVESKEQFDILLGAKGGGVIV